MQLRIYNGMATAKVKTVTTVESVTLTLSEREAKFLRCVLGMCFTDDPEWSVGTERIYDAILFALDEAGVEGGRDFDLNRAASHKRAALVFESNASILSDEALA